MTDAVDLGFLVSFVSTAVFFNGFALRGLAACFKAGNVRVFLDFSWELGGLLEFEFDLVLRLSDGVWYFVFSLAPPIAEQKTAYN